MLGLFQCDEAVEIAPRLGDRLSTGNQPRYARFASPTATAVALAWNRGVPSGQLRVPPSQRGWRDVCCNRRHDHREIAMRFPSQRHHDHVRQRFALSLGHGSDERPQRIDGGFIDVLHAPLRIVDPLKDGLVRRNKSQ